MTVCEWIKEMCGYWGIPYSNSLYISLAGDTFEDELINDELIEKIEINLFKHIPFMLSSVKQVSEGGFSVAINTEGLKDLYLFLYRKYGDKYGLEDNFGLLNTIEDKTDVW